MDNRRSMDPGEVVAHRFVIESRAGAGGMGTVFRARDRVTGVPVAVKLVLDEGAGLPRFSQEARVLSELEHPAIVRYVAHGVGEGGRHYLVMEWLEGEDLAARLARGPLTLEEVLAVGRRVAEALAVAHGQAVVHRDVKPANVFLEGGGADRAKVLDFGIARTRNASAFETTMVPITRTGMVIGTVGYMSPEQARGATDVDARTDVFALGCLLFECLTGRPAFSGANPVAVLAKVLLEDAPRARSFRREIPADLDELVARMLAKDPAARPRDGGAALRALSAMSATGGRTSSNSGSGLADREQRFVSIVLARGLPPEAKAPGEPIVLADKALLYALRGPDPVTEAASLAMALRAHAVDAAIAVACGRVDATHDGALGPIIDRAATLDSKPGETLVDELSVTLLLDRFDFDGPAERRALVGPARRSTEPRKLLGKRTPFVGRDKELALLSATFEECSGDSVARAVLITSPPGGGKSRLQHELVGRIRDEARLLFARGDPMGAGGALGIARQLLRSAASIREGEPASRQYELLRAHLEGLFSGDALERASDLLGELIGAPPETPGPALRAARNDARVLGTWLRRAFEEWSVALCDQQVTLLVVEDLHWGDRTSISYLEDALRKNAGRPLMLVALARPEIHDLFPDVWTRAGFHEIRLPALTRRSAEKLVRAALPEADETTVAQLVTRAEGNAFCLEELVRHVAEGARDSLPETVLALAEARLARLDPAFRRVLRAASVFGEVCWDGAVAALLDDDQRVTVTLRSLVDLEVLVAREQSRFADVQEYAFRHGLLREVAYTQLTDGDRAVAHGRAADWLEHAGERDAHLLAEHLERSDDPKRAIAFLEVAVGKALEAFDYTVANGLAERAVRLGASGDGLGRMLSAIALYMLSCGDWANGARHAKQAYGLLRGSSSDAYGAAAMTLMAGGHVGDFELAPQIVQDMLTTEPEVPTGLYGMALQMVVNMLDILGQHDSAWQLVERGRRLAARTPDAAPTFIGWLEYAAASASMKRDWMGEWFAAGSRGRAGFASESDPFGSAIVQFGWGVAFAELGQPARARRELAESARMFRKGGQEMFLAWCTIHEAWTYWDERRYDDALTTVAPYLGHHADFRHARALAAFACLGKGDLVRAEEHLARALEGIGEFLVTPWVVTIVHVADAAAKIARGRHADALEAVGRAQAASQDVMPPYVRSLVAQQLIEALLGLGDLVAARAELEKALRRLDRIRAELPAELATFDANRPNARILALAREHLGQSP